MHYPTKSGGGRPDLSTWRQVDDSRDNAIGVLTSQGFTSPLEQRIRDEPIIVNPVRA